MGFVLASYEKTLSRTLYTQRHQFLKVGKVSLNILESFFLLGLNQSAMIIYRLSMM